MNFECEPYTRLAIYSASYGRTQYQSVQCPQPQGVAEESKCMHDYKYSFFSFYLIYLTIAVLDFQNYNYGDFVILYFGVALIHPLFFF